MSSSSSGFAQLVALKAQAQGSGARFCAWLTGSQAWAQQQACALLADEPSVIYIGEAPATWPVRCFSAQQTTRLLGQEARFVVYDAFRGVNPDTLGQIAGLVSEGGLFVLLSAPPEQPLFWQDPEKARLCVTPAAPESVGDAFLQYTRQVLGTDAAVMRWDQQHGQPSLPVPVNVSCTARDTEQMQVVATLYQQALTGQLQAAVLTAARGRGKSAALGMLAQRLGEQGWQVAMTAPEEQALLCVREYAGCHPPQFCPVSEVTDPATVRDLLLVDEAAMLPVDRLKQIVQTYPRVVFATTTEGYEGTGQGFALRFLPWLKQHASTAVFRLQMPIRWLPDDPLETLFNRWLLLAATHIEPVEYSAQHPLCIHEVNRAGLVSDPQQLATIFGLLVNAHYRTTPGDLRVMLDSPNIRLWVARQGRHLLGTCLLASEGPLPDSLNHAIWEGTRRPRGHLLPQLMVAQEGHQEAGALQYVRVVRIAVVDEVRQQGIAHRLLQTIEQHAAAVGVDFIGASFAASDSLLAFWRAQSYTCVRVGTAVDAHSGSAAVTVLKPLQPSSVQVLTHWQHYYQAQLPYLLKAWLSTLDQGMRLALCQEANKATHYDEAALWQRVQGFALAKRSPESSAYSLNTLLALYPQTLAAMPEQQARMLGDFVYQPHVMELLIERYRLPGRKALISCLRQAAQCFLQTHLHTRDSR